MEYYTAVFFFLRLLGNSLAAQVVSTHTFAAQGPGSIPDRGTKGSQCTYMRF